MRQVREALPLKHVCGATGEVRRAEVFVAVLGASNFTYAG